MSASQRYILLVEDSMSQAVKMTDILEKAGWKVTWANTAEAAFTSLSSAMPDLMLLDFVLPGVRGDEVCRRLRRNIDTRNLPVVMLTSDDTSEAELRGLDSGADDFISKSADPEVLVLRLKSLLAKVHRQSDILAPSETAFRSARLLAIDDSATFLERLKPELESEGYEVETSLDAMHGLDRVREERFDGVIIDLSMPGLDGLEVCRRINQMRKSMEAPLITMVLTGRETKEDHSSALRAGADDFVGKSGDISILKGRIRALLRRKFFEEENRRILGELRQKELEAVRERAEKEAVQARAKLVEELERTAAELRRSEQDLKLANQAKDRFMAILSHELRTPLTPVLATISLWQEDDRLPGDVRKDISMVRRNVELEARLIDDLLDLTRISRGKLELRLAAVDIRKLVEQAIAICKGNDGETAPILNEFTLPDATISGDESRLTQVLWNLLRNAVKFTPPAGRITVRGYWAEDTSSQSGKSLVIEVADTGIGVEQDALPTIFDAFQQGGREVTRKYGGLGLGLAISKAIVELHGGRLTAESPGRDQGSIFRVSLPQRAGMVQSTVRETAPDIANPPAPVRGLSILLVEDHPDTSRALERLLTRKGHSVKLARTIAGARELIASSERFDLLMSDLGLPDGTGTDLIRSLPAESRPPAIALSGYGMESDIRKSTEAGFQFHFTKPIDLAMLESAIATIQAQRQPPVEQAPAKRP